jgi:hypothetical protein
MWVKSGINGQLCIYFFSYKYVLFYLKGNHPLNVIKPVLADIDM